PLPQRIFWALAVAVVTATLLVFSGTGGLEALQSTIILVGLPFFIIAYFQIYALMRALREDAGVLPRLRMRRRKKVLPPGEVERRRADADGVGHGSDEGAEVVTRPQPEDPAPEFRDPYIEAPAQRKQRHGTLASRTGSRSRSQDSAG